MVNEMVVTNGLIGSAPPSESMMPPTTDTTANTTLSSGVMSGRPASAFLPFADSAKGRCRRHTATEGS